MGGVGSTTEDKRRGTMFGAAESCLYQLAGVDHSSGSSVSEDTGLVMGPGPSLAALGGSIGAGAGGAAGGGGCCC